MLPDNLDKNVSLFLHWNDRVKKLPLAKRRAVHAEDTEFYWLIQAATDLYILYTQLVDPNTAHNFNAAKEYIANDYAFIVEGMIYRISQLLLTASPRRREDLLQFKVCLTKVSEYLLPIAVPDLVSLHSFYKPSNINYMSKTTFFVNSQQVLPNGTSISLTLVEQKATDPASSNGSFTGHLNFTNAPKELVEKLTPGKTFSLAFVEVAD